MAFVHALQLSTLMISQALILLFAALPADAFPSVNCTESSFRTPALAVDELHYSARLKIGSFRVTNIAINYTTVISCEAGQCALDSRGNGDDRVDTWGSATVDGGSVSISLYQSWICSDKRWNDTVPVRLNFTATATTALPVKCDSVGACTAVKRLSLLKASLLSPMAGTPRWLEPITGQTVPQCRPSPSGAGLWEVSNVKWIDRDRPCFNFGGPAPPVCAPNGMGLDVEVYNRVLNMTTRCSGMMRYQYPPDATMNAVHCEPVVVKARRYTTQTSVILLREGDGSLATVQVNQTWHCDDEGPDRPVEIQVHSAPIPIQLSCTYDNGTIDLLGGSWHFQETTCIGTNKNKTTSLPVASSTTVYIPPYSLEEPWNDYYAGTCLLRHLRTTGWATDLVAKRVNFSSVDISGSPKVAEISFFADSRYLHAGGPGNRVPVPLRPGTNDTAGTVWADCYPPGEKTDYPCRFKFESATGSFTLKRFTRCDDIDRAHPYLITTTASYTYPPMDCTWKDYYPAEEKGVITRCIWQADPRVTEMMRVQSLSDIVWEPMPQGFSATLWDGRPASAFPWLEPAR